MQLKGIALALSACLALGVFAANTASAAEGDGWTIEGTKIASGTHQSVSCEKHFGVFVPLNFTSTLLGSEVELEAEWVNCLEAQIDNTTSKGHSEGRLRFVGVKVLKPSAKCSVRNVGGSLFELTTAALTDQVFMDPSGGSVVFDKFFPEVSGGAFFTIEFAGSECPLNEASAPLKGSLCGESVHTVLLGNAYATNLTGELRVEQTLLFGAAQQTTGGCALTLGTKAAQFAGAIDTKLAVTNVGKTWGAD